MNLTTVFTLCRDVGNHMISMRKAQASAPRPRGKIINVASVLSYSGGLTVPAYASSKAALLGLTKSFSNEWSSQEINISRSKK